MLTVGLNRAVTLIAEKIANPGKGRRFGADPGRSLGEHPQRGGAILVKKGRYGPYVTNNGINATIPDNKNPEEVTLDEAVALIEARAEKTGAKPAPRRKGPRKADAPRRKARGGCQTEASEGRKAEEKTRRQIGEKVADGGRIVQHCAFRTGDFAGPGLVSRHLEKTSAQGPRGPRALPSREELLAFIGTHKGKAGVREIARAFGLKNDDRAALKTHAARACRRGKGRAAAQEAAPRRAPCPPWCSPTSPSAMRTAN